MAETKSDGQIAGELGLNPYVVKLLRPQVAQFSREELLAAIGLLYQVEKDVKMSILPALPAAEIFLIRLMYNISGYWAVD